MKLLFAALALLLLALAPPATADMYPDASNAKLPDARINLGAAAQSGEKDVREFGAIADGVTDAVAAFNACLTAMAGKTCTASGRFALTSGDIVIPAQTTLACRSGITDAGGVPTNYTTYPALILSSAHTITGDGGGGQRIEGCVIYRQGMSFPTTSAAGFAGTAITDGNAPNFQVVDSLIMGFQSAFYGTGERPYLRNINFDASGGDGTTATHAGIDIRNGNTESGYLENIKGLNFSALSTTDCGNLRPGTGLRINGYNYTGTLTIENYQITNIEIGAIVMGDKWWTDYISSCPRASSVGVLITSGGIVRLNQLATYASQTAIRNVSGSSANNSSISDLTLNQIGGDCIVMGGTGVAAGLLTIGSIATMPGSIGCGGHVVSFLDTTASSAIQLGGGSLKNTGGSTPYIQPLAGVTLSSQIAVNKRLVTDASPASSLYGPVTLGTPTGLGSTGTAAFAVTFLASPWVGTILITPNGTGIGAGGNLPIGWPVRLNNFHGCQLSLSGVNAFWPSGSTVYADPVDATHTTFIWVAAGSLTPGSTYAVVYNCEPQ